MSDQPNNESLDQSPTAVEQPPVDDVVVQSENEQQEPSQSVDVASDSSLDSAETPPQMSDGDAKAEPVETMDEQPPEETQAAESADEQAQEAVAEEVQEDETNAAVEEVAEESEEAAAEEEERKDWYILKVQVNREDSIREALLRRIKIEGLEEFFGDIVVPTEEVAEFNKNGKRRVVKKKLYPGYILVNMFINDETWFLVRETPGVGDFTGSAGKPTPMEQREVERILKIGAEVEGAGGQVKTAIPFKAGDHVRVKDGYFQNFEGDVETVDEANGRITVMINIFGRSTPVELEHWQVESI